jgi:competence ComEA-like helix-hairpin-helix protein
MLTRSEKTYLALTLAFLAAGAGIKAWRRASVRLGPFPDAATLAQDSLRAGASVRAGLSAGEASGAGPADPVPAVPAAGSGAAGRIDLNRADAAALMRMPGIGAKTAEAILAWRRARGPFRDVRDLLQIKGIGEKKLEKLAPHIIL